MMAKEIVAALLTRPPGRMPHRVKAKLIFWTDRPAPNPVPVVIEFLKPTFTPKAKAKRKVKK